MKLHRVALPDPLLLFLIALIGGALWLLNPVADAAALLHPDTPRVAVIHPPVPAPRTEPLQPPKAPDLAAVRAQLEAAEKEMRERAATLDTQNAEIDVLQRRVDALRAELAALEAHRSPVDPAAATALSTEETRAEDLVKQRQMEESHLASELASLKTALEATPSVARRVPRAVGASAKLPVLIDLSGNRIAPVTPEFFHFPMLTLSPDLVATRKRPGETIAEARAPGSQFARFLSKTPTDTRFISCLLNRDSFEAYFAVRDMATRAGFDIAWEAADTSSGKITIQRVKLVSKQRSAGAAVALPDVMR
jgi:hypothetical protein